MGAKDKWGMWGVFFWLFVMARLTTSRRTATISTANDRGDVTIIIIIMTTTYRDNRVR